MTTPYLKYYKIKLTTLSPLFIGSGQFVKKLEYVFARRRVYIIDPEKLMKLIIKRNLTSSYTHFIRQGGKYKKLYDWLKENNITDFESISAYTLKGTENLNPKSLKEIHMCVKDAYGRPYVPGSSLKGLLRTIILWNKIYDSKNNNAALSNISRSVLNNARRITDPREIKKVLAKDSDEIEKLFFNTEIPDARGGEPVSLSKMRGLMIGDSKPLSLDDIVLCSKTDVRTNNTENEINIHRECIRPNKTIEFDMTVDEAVLGFGADDLTDMIKNYAEDIFNAAVYPFPFGDEEDSAVFFGGGAGYFSKTVPYVLFDNKDAVNFVKHYLDKTTTTPRVHKHFNDTKISPHMQKCTYIGDKIYEMGKCRLEIVKNV